VSEASAWRAYRSAVADVAGPADRATVLVGVIHAVARALRVEPPAVERDFAAAPHVGVAALEVPAVLARPDLPGWVLESLLDPDRRHRAGAYYTPPGAAAGLVTAALDGWQGPDQGRGRSGDGPAVCDPSVGGGAFLLAAARALRATGTGPADVIADHLWGVDIDPVAVATSRAVLGLWAATEGTTATLADDRLTVGDFLADPVPGWAMPPRRFDVVVGNPPFQGQLATSTARSADSAAGMRAWLGDAVHGYVDTAALFLVAACRRTGAGGRVALILPESVLAAAHATGARRSVRERAGLQGLWLPGVPMFSADVRVCAPVLEVGAAPVEKVRRWSGPDVTPDGELAVTGRAAPAVVGLSAAPGNRPPATSAVAAPVVAVLRRSGDVDRRPGTGVGVRRSGDVDRRPGTGVGERRSDDVGSDDDWARLLAAAGGLPAVDLGVEGPLLSSIASATAGFRQHFYGLADHVREGDDRLPPLVTVGAIDPARSRWGQVDLRFAGRRWRRPAVDIDSLAADDPEIARWVTARLVPKVLVATQTRVVEAVADPGGAWVPSVPVIAVTPRSPDRLWHLAAVLLAPPVSVWAAERVWGSGLGKGTIRLSARLVDLVPLPTDVDAWDRGAALARAAHRSGARSDLLETGRAMTAAYGLGPAHPALVWWSDRLPDRSGRSTDGPR
jgi:hypothetical protein